MTFNSASMRVAVACAMLVASSIPTRADDTAPADAQQTAAAPLAPGQVDSLVAPIALYPDSLLSQVLVACTYPLEIVQAEQWLQQHPDLQGDELTAAAKQESWDPSIQALVVFPDVLKRLSQDITWTTDLGNAFLAHQGEVMDAVQRLRAQAQQAGKLRSTDQVRVVNTVDAGQPVVEIQPANPQIIYVPDYDPVWIWGPAPVYYPYPVWYYPPRPVGLWCDWYPGVSLSVSFIGCCGWGGWGWAPHWHERTVIVNNYFIHRYNFHTTYAENFRGETVWHHDPIHRIGVAYPNRVLAARFRAEPRERPTVIQTQARFHVAAQRFQADRIGNRQIAAGPYVHNRSAFGGVEQGTVARVQSSRGFSSLNRSRRAMPAAARGVPAKLGGRGVGARGGGHGAGGWGHGEGARGKAGGPGGGNGGGGERR